MLGYERADDLLALPLAARCMCAADRDAVDGR